MEISMRTTSSLIHFHSLLFDYIRKIRAEALNLLDTTAEIITNLHDTSQAENEAQMRIQYALAIGSRIISEHGPQVQIYFDAINTLLEQHSELNDLSGE